MNRDEVHGKKEELKGRVKEAAGVVSGNRRLEDEGADERRDGETEHDLGRARRKIGEAVEDLGDRIKR